ncbi:hypothetical protein [Streptomyces sp. NPDC020681]|uniref:hypothetical protein n=1 Tax=Streptomyces sp. NPDC020681 TaxID=3365083 RepID=UPI00379F13FB
MALRTATVAACILALALTGCSTSVPDVVEQTAAGSETSDAPAASASAKPDGRLISSGFGQQDEFVWVTSLVRNDSKQVGQTVTVQFNVLNATGNIIGSESQVESFSRPEQLLVLGTQVDVPTSEKATRVEATLLVEEAGAFSDSPFPEIPTSAVTIGKGEYGDTTGTFEVSNPTNAPLKNARVGIICYNAKQNVIGGASEYPDLVPPSGKIRIDSTLNTRGTPAKCDAYAGPGI